MQNFYKIDPRWGSGGMEQSLHDTESCRTNLTGAGGGCHGCSSAAMVTHIVTMSVSTSAHWRSLAVADTHWTGGGSRQDGRLRVCLLLQGCRTLEVSLVTTSWVTPGRRLNKGRLQAASWRAPPILCFTRLWTDLCMNWQRQPEEIQSSHTPAHIKWLLYIGWFIGLVEALENRMKTIHRKYVSISNSQATDRPDKVSGQKLGQCPQTRSAAPLPTPTLLGNVPLSDI